MLIDEGKRYVSTEETSNELSSTNNNLMLNHNNNKSFTS